MWLMARPGTVLVNYTLTTLSGPEYSSGEVGTLIDNFLRYYFLPKSRPAPIK